MLPSALLNHNFHRRILVQLLDGRDALKQASYAKHAHADDLLADEAHTDNVCPFWVRHQPSKTVCRFDLGADVPDRCRRFVSGRLSSTFLLLLLL
jgi:hypothetical protein